MMTFCHNMVLIRVFFSGLGIAAARFCAYPVDLDGERMQIEFTTDATDDELGATAFAFARRRLPPTVLGGGCQDHECVARHLGALLRDRRDHCVTDAPPDVHLSRRDGGDPRAFDVAVENRRASLAWAAGDDAAAIGERFCAERADLARLFGARSCATALAQRVWAAETLATWQEGCLAPPIFVAGAPHTGTSLVFASIAAHARVAPVRGETGLFLFDSEFDWTKTGFAYGDVDAPCGEEGEHARKTTVCLARTWSPGALCGGATGAARVIEKTPWHVFAIRSMLGLGGAGARAVLTVRDGRDAAASLAARLVQEARENPGRSSAVRNAAKVWTWCLTEARRWALHPAVVIVRYELLVGADGERASRDALARLFADVGLEDAAQRSGAVDAGACAEARASFWADARAGENGRRRAEEAFCAPLSNRSVGRWRRDLSADDRLMCHEHPGFDALLLELGYVLETEPDWWVQGA